MGTGRLREAIFSTTGAGAEMEKKQEKNGGPDDLDAVFSVFWFQQPGVTCDVIGIGGRRITRRG